MDYSTLRSFLQQHCIFGIEPTSRNQYRVNGKVLRDCYNSYARQIGHLPVDIAIFSQAVMTMVPGIVHHEINEGYVFEGVTLINSPRTRMVKTLRMSTTSKQQAKKEYNKRYYEKRKMATISIGNVQSDLHTTIQTFVRLSLINRNGNIDDVTRQRNDDELDRLDDLLSREEHIYAMKLVNAGTVITSDDLDEKVQLANISTTVVNIPMANIPIFPTSTSITMATIPISVMPTTITFPILSVPAVKLPPRLRLRTV
jgi:hypothetical protein